MKLDVKPEPKPRMTQRDRWKERPCVMRYRAYCDELNLKLGRDYKLPGSIQIKFYIPMPKSWTKKKKKARDGKPHKRRPDLDNFIKAFLDSLTSEDNYVWHIDACKYNAREGAIEIKEVNK